MEPMASAALIVRAPDGRVLVSRRAAAAPFLGGFLAFLGGRVEAGDPERARRWFGGDDEVSVARATAVRELHEETGLALTAAGIERAASLDAALEAHGPCVGLAPAGRWVTPDYAPIRFDTLFFLADVPAVAEPLVDARELEWAGFLTPAEVLERHRRQEVLLPRPTQRQLEVLAAGGDVNAELIRVSKDDEGDFEAMHGIWQLPLRTPTLPPATHTNCYVVGVQRAVIVDPATYDDHEREKLAGLLERLRARGTQFVAVVLTHHHGDHIGSARWVAERLSIPVWAHPETARLLEGEVQVDGNLNEGDLIRLGTDERGEPFTLRCLHTPGHAAGHLVLVDERRGVRAMIVGDMVAAVGTIIVDPDEGHMGTYLAQLRRLKDSFPDGLLFAAHGPPITLGHAKLEHYIQHRLGREAKVRSALLQLGRGTADDLVPLAYADTPQALWPLAARACLAHLVKLEEDGEARVEGSVYVATASGLPQGDASGRQ